MNQYVHGYSEKESCRLADQAGTLTELLHGDTAYPDGSRVLDNAVCVLQTAEHAIGHLPRKTD